MPSWVTYSSDEITTLIVKFARDGLNPSQIGLKLRDQYNIPLTKPLVSKSVTQILKENKLLQPLPDDLNRILKNSKALQEHLKKNRGDRKNVRSLELQEAKIHRLSKHYKKKGILPLTWKYSAAVAQLE